MATNETIIFDLKVDMTKALEQQQTLKKSIEDIRAAQKENADKTSAEYITNEATLKNLNNQLLNNSKILQANAQSATDETGAYRKLSDAYLYQAAKAKDLAVAYGATDERTKVATASAKAMSDQLKAVDQSVGQANRNVGNYKESLNTLAPALGGTVTGLLNMGKALLTLLANPIGLVIGAIAAAFYGLYTVLKNFDPVLDMIEQGFSMVSGAFTALKENVLAVITGQKSLKDALSGVGGEMSKAAKEAQLLKKAQQDLEDLQKISAVTQEKYKNQIAELILQSKNRTLTEKQRIALIDEALKIEDKAFKEKKAMADEEVRIAQMLIANGRGLTAQELSNLKTKGIAYAIDLSQKKQISDEEIALLQTALIKQQQIEGESIALREKAENRRDALIKASQEEREKQNAKIAKDKADKDAKEIADEANRIAELEKHADKEISILQANLKTYLDANDVLLADKELTNNQIHELEVQRIEAERTEKIAEQDAKLKANAAYQEQYNAITLQLNADANKQLALNNIAFEDAEKERKLTVAATDLQNEIDIATAKGQSLLNLQLQQNEASRTSELEDAEKTGADKQLINEKYTKLAIDLTQKEKDAKLSLYSGFAGNLATIFGKNTVVGKAAASAQVAIDTYKGAMAAYTSMAGIPVVGIGLGIAAAAAVGVTGVKAIKDIWAVPVPGGGGGGGSAPSISPVSGGGSIPQASVAGGIVARSTSPSQAAQVAQGVGSALQANPMQPVLVTNDLTIAQNQKVELKTNNSL